MYCDTGSAYLNLLDGNWYKVEENGGWKGVCGYIIFWIFENLGLCKGVGGVGWAVG